MAVCEPVASGAAAQAIEYGSFRFDPRLANVLFLVGEINAGDSFEMRRAMRDNNIRLVVTASGGGNLYEGLQLAAVLDDKGIATFLPSGLSCESSCANVFFGGAIRRVDGDLGVHQFYVDAEGATAPERADITTAATLYTTSDIIGMMNVLETPPFVYERMLSTTDIYYFSEPEKALLERGAADVGIAGTMQEADAFVAAHPDIVERRRLVPPAEAQDAAIAPDARPRDAAPAAPVGVDHLEDLDFFGADLIPTGVRDVSLSGCGRIRRDDTRCAAYSYMVETRWCWPKSGVENVSAARGVVRA